MNKLTVAVTSFVGLAAVIFQPCYSIKCYVCLSENNEYPQCNNIVSDEYLKNCKNDDTCVKGVFENADSDYSGIYRSCQLHFDGDSIKRGLEEMKNANGNVNVTTCTSDRCNGSRMLMNAASTVVMILTAAVMSVLRSHH